MKLTNKIQTLIELPVRVLGPASARKFSNVENNRDYDFVLNRINRSEGVSCMIRAKNEEDKILSCLNSILGVFEEIVFIDNGSEDKTLSIARAFAENNPEQQVQIFSYPHSISRCGDENSATDENSLSALAYYYNWCLSKCRYAYVCKWDADMLLHPLDKDKLKQVFNEFSSWWPCYLDMEIQTIYIKQQDIYLSQGEINSELRLFPNRADVHFIKEKLFEKLDGKLYRQKRMRNEKVRIYEIKNVNIDEFSNWSTTEFTTERKKREWENYNKVFRGELDESFVLAKDEQLVDAISGEFA